MTDIDIILSLALAAKLHQNNTEVVAQAKRMNQKVTDAQRKKYLIPLVNSKSPIDMVWRFADHVIPATYSTKEMA